MPVPVKNHKKRWSLFSPSLCESVAKLLHCDGSENLNAIPFPARVMYYKRVGSGNAESTSLAVLSVAVHIAAVS